MNIKIIRKMLTKIGRNKSVVPGEILKLGGEAMTSLMILVEDIPLCYTIYIVYFTTSFPARLLEI